MFFRTLILVSLFSLYSVVAFGLADVSVSYSLRIIPHGPNPEPAALASEGGVEAIFTGTAPIDLVGSAEGFTRLTDRSFSYIFTWDNTGPMEASFVDGSGDITNVTAIPTPPMQLDTSLHSMPIIHIQTELENLWDPDIGIYVWGTYNNIYGHGSDWERPATFEYYDGTDEPIISAEIGLRLHGGWSRCYDQKGLKFYFDRDESSPTVSYDFFQSEPIDFKRLLIRNHRAPSRSLHSDLGESIFLGLGHLGSRYLHTVVYINNEYWGTYSLRERLDDEFIEYTHGYDGNDYILIKDCESVHGDENAWFSFLGSFSDVPDYQSHDWYTWVEENLDLGSYIDWLLINIFGATADNGGCGNLAFLKLENEPWRYLMWDEDSLFTGDNLENNHFRWFSAATEEEYETFRPPSQYSGSWSSQQSYFRIFNSLMQNSEFKARFFARANELLLDELSVASLQSGLDVISENYYPERDMHSTRWNWYSPSYYDSVLAATRNWITLRHPIVTSHLSTFMEHFRTPVELSQFSAEGNAVQANISWRTESEMENTGFLLYRSIGQGGEMVLIASHETTPALVGAGTTTSPTEYAFSDTTVPHGPALAYQLHHVNDVGVTTVVNWVETTYSYDFNGLTFNELMADNDETILDTFGDADDWIEIHNASDNAINLDGCFISDDLSLPTKHQLAGGMIVGAGQNLILWADNEPEQGFNHLPFKLSADGESLTLYGSDGETLLDAVTFLEQFEDHCYMRYPDTDGDWTYGWDPTPGALNADPRVFEFLNLNEIMSTNTETIADEQGEFEPWLEISNKLPVPVSMAELTLATYGALNERWDFPMDEMAPHSHLVVWLDHEEEDGPYHASITVLTNGGSVGLYAPDGDVIDVEVYPALDLDEVYARIPDGKDWHQTMQSTPGAPNPTTLQPLLVINEFMAKNDSVIQDETGAFEDWVEIFNPGVAAVALEGMYLSDDLTEETKWMFPAVSLAPGEFMIVWCDDDPGDGPLHTNFKLSSDGEEIGLWSSEAEGNQLMDSVVFGAQVADVSLGRTTDAGVPWISYQSSTPGFSNNVATAVPELLSNFNLQAPYPNPFNPTVRLGFSLPRDGLVNLEIFDVRGLRVKALVAQSMTAGEHEVYWYGEDFSDQAVASGTYFVRLGFGGDVRTRRVMLVR